MSNEVRFLKASVKGSTAAKFVGKGNVTVTESQLLAEGKKPLPLGVQVLLFIGIGVVVMLIGFGPSGFLLAFLIDFFARTKESLTIERASVKQVVADPKTSRFQLVFHAGGQKPTNLVFQTLTDAAPLYSLLRESLKDSFRDGEVKGTKTI